MKSSTSRFTNTSFAILDKNALSEILIRLTPTDVLNLCTIKDQFAKICSDQSIFQKLMRYHYPNSYPTKNPKAQYVALTEHYDTHYYLYIISKNYIVNDTEGNKKVHLRYKHDSYIHKQSHISKQKEKTIIGKNRVRIPGIDVDVGSVFYLQITFTGMNHIEVFISLEAAIKEFFDSHSYINYIEQVMYKFRDYLEDFDNNSEDENEETVNSDSVMMLLHVLEYSDFEKDSEDEIMLHNVLISNEFKVFCKLKKYPRSFLRNDLYTYIYNNGFLSCAPTESDSNSIVTYQFIKVTVKD